MTLKTASRFLVALFVVLLAGLPLLAQTGPSRFDVPFAFMAGGQKLPAGAYTVAFNTGHRVTLQCQQAICGASVRIAYETAQSGRDLAPTGTLEFDKYGDLYLLRRARPSGQPAFSELVQSKREAEVVKAYSNRQLATIESR